MNAFHTLRFKNKQYLDDYEILTMILSALEWRKHNGNIFLYTDIKGKEYVEMLGLKHIYNGINACLDSIDNYGINENIFWAGAKIFALQKQQIPCVMMDIDFIVWKRINCGLNKNGLSVIHFENIDPNVYPSEHYFKLKKNFYFPKNLDWHIKPANCAFVIFESESFIKKYCSFAVEFMENININTPDLPYMVFIEQRWLSMCAKLMRLKCHAICNLIELFSPYQDLFTHLWGFKKQIINNSEENNKFCHKCIRRLKNDFPDYFWNIINNKYVNKYLSPQVEKNVASWEMPPAT